MNEETKTIELSMSKNYVCTWGLWEAFREIMQNAQDSAKDGNELIVEDYGGTLNITNKGVMLPISSLVLGNSVKSEGSIGKYGEGYKLALLVLLRLGLEVKIYNNDEVWTPVFKYSDTYNSEVLTISVEGMDVSNEGLTFSIKGLSITQMNELKSKSLVLYTALGGDLGKVVESSYGQVLLDKKYKGIFYVEGLFIQEDSTFEYGYSFNSDYVSLDRDRRAINYYSLLDLTSDTLINQAEDFSIVEYSLSKNTKDTTNLNNFFTEASEEFAVGYAKHFIEKHNIDEDTFVGTRQEAILSGSEKILVTDKVQAKLVNKGLGKEREYAELRILAGKKDDVDSAWKYYNSHVLFQLHGWILDNCTRLSSLQINKFLFICDTISKPSLFDLIGGEVKTGLLKEIKEKNPKFKYNG